MKVIVKNLSDTNMDVYGVNHAKPREGEPPAVGYEVKTIRPGEGTEYSFADTDSLSVCGSGMAASLPADGLDGTESETDGGAPTNMADDGDEENVTQQSGEA